MHRPVELPDRGNQARQDLGAALSGARPLTGRSRRDVATELSWPMTRLELVETGRVRLDHEELTVLAYLYRVRGAARSGLQALGREGSQPSDGDALDWMTLPQLPQDDGDDPRRGWAVPRAIADQLGHARPSMTQDVYMSRGTKNPGAADAIERAMGTGNGPKPGHKP